MASLENGSSTWGNSQDQHFLSTHGCIPLSLVASGHSWWGNAATCAEEKLIPRIASCGKVTLLFEGSTSSLPAAMNNINHQGMKNGRNDQEIFIWKAPPPPYISRSDHSTNQLRRRTIQGGIDIDKVRFLACERKTLKVTFFFFSSV